MPTWLTQGFDSDVSVLCHESSSILANQSAPNTWHSEGVEGRLDRTDFSVDVHVRRAYCRVIDRDEYSIGSVSATYKLSGN